MVAWWVGNAVLFLVVIPVVHVLFKRVRERVQVIHKNVGDILWGSNMLTEVLQGVPELLGKTDRLVHAVSGAATEYGLAVARVAQLVKG